MGFVVLCSLFHTYATCKMHLRQIFSLILSLLSFQIQLHLRLLEKEKHCSRLTAQKHNFLISWCGRWERLNYSPDSTASGVLKRLKTLELRSQWWSILGERSIPNRGVLSHACRDMRELRSKKVTDLASSFNSYCPLLHLIVVVLSTLLTNCSYENFV